MPLRSRLRKIGMDAQSHTGSAAPAKIANSVPLMRFPGKSLNKLLRQKQLNGRGQQHADQQERHGLQHDAEKYGNGRIQFSAKQLPQAKRRTASQRKQQQRRQLRLSSARTISLRRLRTTCAPGLALWIAARSPDNAARFAHRAAQLRRHSKAVRSADRLSAPAVRPALRLCNKQNPPQDAQIARRAGVPQHRFGKERQQCGKRLQAVPLHPNFIVKAIADGVIQKLLGFAAVCLHARGGIVSTRSLPLTPAAGRFGAAAFKLDTQNKPPAFQPRGEQVIQQRGFARTEKARHHIQRQTAGVSSQSASYSGEQIPDGLFLAEFSNDTKFIPFQCGLRKAPLPAYKLQQHRAFFRFAARLWRVKSCPAPGLAVLPAARQAASGLRHGQTKP